jgi:hypothetical protein
VLPKIPALCAGGCHAMANNSTKLSIPGAEGEGAVGFLDDWFGPIEAGLRDGCAISSGR